MSFPAPTDLSIEPVKVQGPFGIEVNYDICLHGRPVKGARHDTRADAEVELQIMQRALGG